MVKGKNWSHEHHPCISYGEKHIICVYCNRSTISIKRLLLECLSLTEERSSFLNPTRPEIYSKNSKFTFLIHFLKIIKLYDKN